ncbi:tRNA dihydrouridine synthase DusB [Methylobacterium isbiliense]|uniref:tRNA dihydrouridine synthase DusB n=1 Tax=Methylobacterium isbiliense TaxID=315478 RepID=UPI0025B2CAB7|nr:tRNA dihydrouridine synthase DusB [Methylobacterium isbiliense]MDN3624765.1 tRNA dihydrouridine synthase DusB [Methylobacterium isbiliense]
MTIDHYLSASTAGIGTAALPAAGAPEPGALLAPLSGVTDLALRRIARRLGATAVVSEMVAAEDFARGTAEARLRAEGEGVLPHVVQLAGCDPRWMAEGARLAEASGADAIDVNMGCPAKKVTGGEAGSALMRDLDHAARLLAAVRGAVSVPVTVKMRLGWDDASRNAPDLARRAQDLGLSAVTVHGRTRQQFYTGRADWAAIRAVTEAVTVPVVANGDVGSLEEARACLAASGARAVMIGRAAVGRPWLVGAMAAGLRVAAAPRLTACQKADLAAEHYEGLLALYGTGMGVRHARKHLAAYADHAGGLSAPERMRLVTTTDPAEALALLRRAFAQAPAEAAPAAKQAAPAAKQAA